MFEQAALPVVSFRRCREIICRFEGLERQARQVIERTSSMPPRPGAHQHPRETTRARRMTPRISENPVSQRPHRASGIVEPDPRNSHLPESDEASPRGLLRQMVRNWSFKDSENLLTSRAANFASPFCTHQKACARNLDVQPVRPLELHRASGDRPDL